MKNKNTHTLFKLNRQQASVIFIFYLAFYHIANGGDKQWKPMLESECIDILQTIQTQSRANYETICSWQGNIDITEENHYYGNNAPQAAYIHPKCPAVDSKHICRTVASNVEFAVDLTNDKLFSNVVPQVDYRAIDLNLVATTRDDVRFSRIRSIITPKEYMTYEPDHTFGYDSSFLVSAESNGKAAFLDVPEKAKNRLNGDIRDPQLYFVFNGYKIWEKASREIDKLLRIGNPAIGGAPHITISEREVDGYTQYEIMTRFKGSDEQGDYIESKIVVDSAVACNVIKQEVIDRGVTRIVKQLTYEKNGDVFVPRTVLKISFDEDGKKVFQSKGTFTKIVINEIIPDEMFTYEQLGLENGVRFVDNVKKIEYWYRDGDLVPASTLIEEAIKETMDQIERSVGFNKAILETNGETTEVSFGKDIFIPRIQFALKHNLPFILDLNTCELMKISKDDLDNSCKELLELGMGDIAWNGTTLIATRNSVMYTVPQESHRPLVLVASGQVLSRYELPTNVLLPYVFAVNNNEEIYYLVRIREISPIGIRLAYGKIPKEKTGYYVPTKKVVPRKN